MMMTVIIIKIHNNNDYCPLWPKINKIKLNNNKNIIESVDFISRDERGFPLMQYITNGGISRAGYTITHFKHHHRVL